MSLFFGLNGGPEVKDYSSDGRTKQAFRDETDINSILAKFQVSGIISHMAKYEAQYGDYAEFDFLDTQNFINTGLDMFAALPSEVRREFDQDPDKFFQFVNDPANNQRVNELLPGIANPGDYFPDVSSETPPGALSQGGEPGVVVNDPLTQELNFDSGTGERIRDRRVLNTEKVEVPK